MANTYAGEIGVSWGDRDYLFRPSLAAMATLGTPPELLDILTRSQSVGVDGFLAALNVLNACYVGDADDLDRLIGCIRDVRGRLRYVMGAMSQHEVHVLGARLAVSGMIGEPKRRGKDSGKQATGFDPAEFVGAAQAHLGASAHDAWQMTMVELQRALDAKYPPDDDEQDTMTTDDVQATIDRINNIRAAKGVH